MVNSLRNALAVLILLAGYAHADDDRDRKARVALAMVKVERIPAPKPMPLPGYAEAHWLARKNVEPLVVFVGCSGSHPIEQLPNVVIAATRELEGYERGSIVIGYPRNGQMFVHAVLRCSDHGALVVSAVEAARNKLGNSAKQRAVSGSPCGDGSDGVCPNGECPRRSPIVVAPP